MARSILLIEWKSFGNAFIKEAFERLGYEVEGFYLDHKAVDTRRDSEYTEKIVYAILAKAYEFVFSFNYFPIVAMACKACGCPYVSWTYDSPFIQLYSQTALYDTNYLFVFDRGVCMDLERKGIRSFYLPMAAPMDCYEGVLGRAKTGSATENEHMAGMSYGGEITFVGSLYDEISGNLLGYLDKLGETEKGYVDGLIQAQKKVYGYNFVEEVLTDNPDRMAAIQKVCPVYAQGDGLETAEWVFANYFVNRKVTVEERKEVLQLLAANHSVHLYTTSTTELEGVNRHKNVDYHREAPLVYANSKINLNITLRSILTGIPLRAFDIIGCGGFLLSNYQADFPECFEPEREFVFYNDYEDLQEKVTYYLNHDAQREHIARQGRERVRAEHTYLHRARHILEVLSQE
ncbi:MAG: glycosyltransferase [Lachnospiraceae bacterium]|nr:glycosyltransferase [Lachnospiraceae bacterium]